MPIAALRTTLLGVTVLVLSGHALGANAVWNQKGTAWEDPANWSTGQTPGPDDIAIFPDVGAPIKNQPVVAGTVRVGGIVLGTGPETNVVIPDFFWRVTAAWTVNGTGTIAVGKHGIAMAQGNSVIHPSLELTENQTWSIGSPAQKVLTPTGNPWLWNERDFIDAELMIITDWGMPNRCNLAIYGNISGPGGIRKVNRGKVFFFAGDSPTFRGGTRVNGGELGWLLPGLKETKQWHFGSGPIVLDGGFFNFSSKNGANTERIRLMNVVQVAGRGGAVQCTQPGEEANKPRQTPRSLFSGPLDLCGVLTVGRQGCGYFYPELDGPITVYQGRGASPGVSCTAWVSMGQLVLKGAITDGPGDAGNPLILRNYQDGLTVANPQNTYAGPTISTYTGGEEGGGQRWGIVFVAPESQLGKGDLLIEPGGQVRLAVPTNLAEGAEVLVGANAVAAGVLGVAYNGVPKLSADSSGVLAVECDDFDAVSDLSKLGNGRMRLGARDCGTFAGKSLKPGADNLYRLGGGSSGGAVAYWENGLLYAHKQPTLHSLCAGTLTIEHGVLQGTAGVEVGAVCRLGNGAVLFKGPNTFSGPLTVQGPDEVHEGHGWPGSFLEGLAQPQAGQSPFGTPTGPVRLLDSTLRLTGVPGGQPVAKGELTCAGNATIALNTDKKGPAVLCFTKLVREGRSVLMVDPQHGILGDQEKLLFTQWRQNVDLLPPHVIYSSRDRHLDFLSYDATGGKGVCRCEPTSKDLLQAKPTDVVETGKVALAGGMHTVRALKANTDITGTGVIRVLSGGVILAGHIAPDVDFGDAEGVICECQPGGWDPCVLRGKVSGRKGITVSAATIRYSFKEGVGLVNSRNDFKGPVTVNNCVLVAVLDHKEKDGTFTAGSLGDLNNEIVLDGGMLAMAVDKGRGNCLAPTRTIRLGPGGGVLIPPAYMKSIEQYVWPQWYTIYAKITGPGSLTSNNNGSPRIIIANPENDYSGGTWVVPQENPQWRVTPEGKLGTGPVLVATECCLTIEGDANIDPKARLTISACGLADFEAAHPRIGSLDGCGYIDLGVQGVPAFGNALARPGHDTTLTVGCDNTDATFWGTIRQRGERAGDGVGALTKTGKGVFTLHGGHTYTGSTTVEQGTLDLRGRVAGDAVVRPAGTIQGSGDIAGALRCEGGTFAVELTGRTLKPLKVQGVVTLDGKLVITTPNGVVFPAGRKWTVVEAAGGVSGSFEPIAGGYQVNIVDGGKKVEVQKL